LIKNQIIWITGASSGLGEAMAHVLSRSGNKLILSARRVEELERVKQSCAHPDDILVLPMDMQERSGMEDLTKQVIQKVGLPDIVILNAGISNRSYIRDTAYDVFEKIMAVNFFGNVAMTKALLPHFIKSKSGKFVVISSLSGKFASPGRGAYSSSKHALHGFFDTLRMEHYEDHIKVLLVCPGFVHTNVTKNSLKGDGQPQGKLDKTTANGMSALEAAARIVNAIEKDKQEVAFGGRERFGLYIKRFFPSLLTKIVLQSQKEWKLENTIDKE
jgi:short-subunit dehydrogenase